MSNEVVCLHSVFFSFLYIPLYRAVLYYRYRGGKNAFAPGQQSRERAFYTKGVARFI